MESVICRVFAKGISRAVMSLVSRHVLNVSISYATPKWIFPSPSFSGGGDDIKYGEAQYGE